MTESLTTTSSLSSGPVVVNELPKFDLLSYINNYRDRTVFRRLYLIGQYCPPLREEAAKLAIREAKKGADVGSFQLAVALLQSVPGYRDSANLLDKTWAVEQEKKNNKDTIKLENELKGYKNNLIKESIRMGNEDLGQHYHSIGDLVNASKAYGRMRDYCTTPTHIAQTAFRIIDVAIEQRAWMAVQAQVVKIQALQMKPDDANRLQIQVPALSGLQRMCNGEYKEAAGYFLSCDPAIGDHLSKIMSPNDIAVYGGLCALASMSRSELQSKVLDNPTFRSFLELEPHIRRATSFFVACKYTQCLEILESYRNDYLLDLYLQSHVLRIYGRIREKSMVQYFEPFGSVSLESMVAVFGNAAVKNNAAKHATNGVDEQSMAQLLSDLIYLIESKKLNARIDLEKRLLVANQPDPRLDTYNEAEGALNKFTKDAYLKIMRVGMTNANLETKAPPTNKKKGSSFNSEWEDDELTWSMGSNDKGQGQVLGSGMFGSGTGRSLRSGK